MESGRYVVGNNGCFVSKVLDRKQSHGKAYIILAGMLSGFMRPAIAHWVGSSKDLQQTEPLFTNREAHSFYALNESTETETVTLAGNLCTSSDIVASDIELPRLAVGDLVCISGAGAYAAALSPMQFSSHGKIKEFFI